MNRQTVSKPFKNGVKNDIIAITNQEENGGFVMGYVEGTGREQVQLLAFDEMVAEDSMARLIDRFIEVCDLKKMGFSHTKPEQIGRPSYDPRSMSKLYVYGYENGVRSSRKLEKETQRNIEVMWLMDGLKPDHKTIAEFRRQNIRPLQKLFHEFVKLCKSWDLIGGELIAVDGTKIKASNNKKMNFSRKKLDARLEHIDEQIREYLTGMDENDQKEEKTTANVPEKLQTLLERKKLYESYREQLNISGENEISLVDPDARLMGNNRGGVDMAYNVQSAVDDKHDLIIEYDVSKNPSDQNQLGIMVKKVRGRIKIKRFTVLADKGYYNGADLLRVKKQKVSAIVSRQNTSNPKDQSEKFYTENFTYDSAKDEYTCPTGKILHPHNKKNAKRRNFFNKTACADCPNRADCTKGKSPYRTVTRREYSKIYEETDKRTQENMELYKRRQQIVEHPFGTIKHTMRGNYFLLRTRRKVRSEVALLFLGYNLKRVIKVLGFQGVMDRLNSLSKKSVAIFQVIAVDFLRLLFGIANLDNIGEAATAF
jgi:transposase/cyclophilin family peptidyl-prolyl cis-trans isomerase